MISTAPEVFVFDGEAEFDFSGGSLGDAGDIEGDAWMTCGRHDFTHNS
jgi:hypothetical protein